MCKMKKHLTFWQQSCTSLWFVPEKCCQTDSMVSHDEAEASPGLFHRSDTAKTNKLQAATPVRSSSVLNHRLECSSALLCASLYGSLRVSTSLIGPL